MAADGTIVIDVTLDDGSVVQGLGRIDDQLGETASRGNKSFGKLGDGIKLVGVAVAAAAAAAAAAAVAIGAGAVSAALKVQEANNRIKQSLGVTTEEAKALTDTARGIYKNGFGESLEEVSDALIKVKQNMTAVDETDLSKATTNAIALAKTFDSDVNEVTRAGNNLMKNFGIDSEKAFDLMAAGAQNGLNFSGELFDNLSEYTPLWADMGFSAEEMFGILNRGADQGVYNFDYLNDVMKEFQIRSTDGSKSTAEAVSALGPAAKKVWEEFSEGKATVADLSAVAATELSKIDDKVKQNELGVALFGTKWEDLGGDVVLAMLESGEAISGFEGAMGKIVATQKEAFGQRWDALLRTSVDALVPLGLMLLDLADTVMPKVQKAVETMSSFFESKMPVIKAVVEDVIENVKYKFEELKTFWDNSGKGIVENVKDNFGMIKSIIEQIMDVVVPLVKEQVGKIVEFWNSDGEQILSAVKTAFNGIKDVIEFVMPAVKFVIEYVWEAIKNVITGALDVIMGAVKVFSGLFTGDFSKMWEGVKQVFSGAIKLILGLMSLSFIGGIKTAIVNFGKTAINLFKNNWNTIINGVKSFVTNFGSNISGMVTKVIGFFKNMYTNTANTIMQMSINVVGRISTMATNMVNAIKGLPAKFLQFGKDIVDGLIKGITGNVEKAVDAIKGVAGAVKDKFMDVLNIHSPSRVFKEYGKFTVEGYQKGINDNTGMATGAITELGKKIKEIGKANSLEEQNLLIESSKKILEIQKAADEKLDNLTTSKMVKKKKVIIDNSKAIAKIEAEEAKKIALEKEKVAKEIIKISADENKKKLDAIKLYVEDKKTLEQLSVKDEINLWATAVNSFKEGTKERVEAQKQYSVAINAVNKELVTVNEKYTKAMTDINNEYIANEKKITEVYESAVEAKEKALFNFMGLFDEFDIKIEKSGVDLLSNLKSQVDGFKEWETEINALSERAIDQGLLKTLTDMGPKALGELKALNSLTDEQLTEYSNLYQEKSVIARKRSEEELVGMKADTEKQIDELKKKSLEQLSGLEKDWVKEINGITQSTKEEFKTLETIGMEAVSGLMVGMESMSGELKGTTTGLAKIVEETIRKSLDIHSPSRVMKKIGVYVVQGLNTGMQDESGNVIKVADDIASKIEETFSNRNIFEGLLKSDFDYNDVFKNLTDLQNKMLEADLSGYERREEAAIDFIKKREELESDLAYFIKVRDKEIENNRLNDEAGASFDAKFISDMPIYTKYESQIRNLKLELESLDNTQKETQKRQEEELKAYQKLAKEKQDLQLKFVAEAKKNNAITLLDEQELYEEYANMYQKDSEQYTFFQNKAIAVRKDINDKMISINKEYTSKINAANEQLLSKEKSINDSYESTLSSRKQTLYGFAGLFDEITKKDEVSGSKLVENLRGQNDELKKFGRVMDDLASRNVDKDLLSQLSNMGPKALNELEALNSLSDEQLTEYVSLWSEKTSIINSQAEKELETLRLNNIDQIEKLRSETESQLDLYQDEWKNAIQSVTGTVIGGLESLTYETEDIGKNVITNLIDGLSAAQPSLVSKVKSIADSIKDTINSALELDSSNSILSGGIGGIKLDNLVNPLRDVKLNVGNISGGTGAVNSNVSNNVNNARTINAPITVMGNNSEVATLSSELRKLSFMYGA